MNVHDLKPYQLLREQARSHRVTGELEIGPIPVGDSMFLSKPVSRFW